MGLPFEFLYGAIQIQKRQNVVINYGYEVVVFT